MTETKVFTGPNIERFRWHATYKGLEIEMRMVRTFQSAKNNRTKGMALQSARRILKENGKPEPRNRKAAHSAMEELLKEKGWLS